MQPNQFSRTAMLIGAEGVTKLQSKSVAVFGLGGVGGHCAEALCRAGIGTFGLFDGDAVSVTNLNRQIIALHSTVGRDKTDVMAERMRDINPCVNVTAQKIFYLPENAHCVDLTRYDYIVDAVDTVAAKLTLVTGALKAKVPIISSMGTGNKLDPTALRLADIYETSICPLARIMRSELRKRGVKSLRVCYSTEAPVKPLETGGETTARRGGVPASCSFVPSAAGLIIAGDVVCTLLGS